MSDASSLPVGLYAQLRELISLSDEDFAAFGAALVPVQLRKNELLLREGEVCRSVAYIEQGCLRYFYNVGGEERTGQFFFEGDWYTDYDSFLDQRPSAQSIQALEPTRVWLLPYAALYRFYAERPVFERFGRLMAEQAYRGSKARGAAFLNHTPTERYEQLLRTRPHLVQRVSQRVLASFLGIKPESLSRIRGRERKGASPGRAGGEASAK
jgi:CRP-like cAMP-binding protein